MFDNIILSTDSYKVTHWKQYPPNTRRVFSFYESRGGRYPTTTFFGLQYILQRYLQGERVTMGNITEAKDFFAAHFGQDLFNEAGWMRIVDEHHGRLPIRIDAVPEGTTVPTGNVLMTAVNTDPELPWLTNYLETLLCQVWYPTTVATQSRALRAVIMRYLEETGDPAGIDFKLHDFGFRGSTSMESAGIGGAAHLVNFKGTDTMAALEMARDYYDEPMAGFSIPAAEHSTITSWGRVKEVDAFRNMLDQFPKGLVAVVSDSYNVFDAVTNLWGKDLWDKVSNRDGTLVIRPDSGKLPDTVIEVLDRCGDAFGFTENDKGFKVLNPKVRVIQGDGIDYITLDLILAAMKQRGWSADNIAFGSGGGLLQKVDRDTQKFAFKCSAIERDGMWLDVMKDPITDPGKKSKAGILKLVKCAESTGPHPAYDHGFDTVTAEDPRPNVLRTVFLDGKTMNHQTFADIRERAAQSERVLEPV